MRIILASKSPRRIEMLQDLGLDFEVVPSNDEEIVNSYKTKVDYVKKLAKSKALSVYKNNKDALVLGFDTLVFLGDEHLGKPHSKEECIDMLKRLRGKTHEVITGAYMISKGYKKSFSSKAYVEFYDYSDEEIIKYASTNEPYDKAGAYAIQGYFGRFVKSVKGDYFTIIGMPKALVYKYICEYLEEKRK